MLPVDEVELFILSFWLREKTRVQRTLDIFDSCDLFSLMSEWSMVEKNVILNGK